MSAGRKAVPALKYAYGLAGVAAAAVAIAGRFASPELAIAGIVLCLAGMLLVWLFARLVEPGKEKTDPAARFIVWATAGVFVICLCLIVSLGVSRNPEYLADMLGLPARVQPPSPDDDELIQYIFAKIQIDFKTVNPKIHDDQRVARNFIDEHLRELCNSAGDREIRQKAHCGTGARSVAAQSLPAPSVLPASTIKLQNVPSACGATALAKSISRPAKIFGLDISHFTTNINWNNLTQNGYYFVFIKATQGTTIVDPKFKENWEAAGRAGFIRGAYHFFTASDGEKEASFFLNALKEVVLGPCDLGAALDLEPNQIASAMPPGPVVTEAQKWLEIVKKSVGKPPILYSVSSYLLQLGDPPSLAGYPLWIASYTATPKLPGSRSSYAFWQFTSGNVGPLASPMAVPTELFNGTPEELYALAR